MPPAAGGNTPARVARSGTACVRFFQAFSRLVGIVLIEKSVTITNKYGLHARPAMQFVEIAGRFRADVRLVRGEKSADAKSIMEVLMLAAENGADLLIKAEGEDARQAVEALSELVASKFDEE